MTKNTVHSLPAIKWTGKLKQALQRGDEIEFDESRIRAVMYRPFTKVWMYEDPRILDKVEAVSSLFPEAPPRRFSAWQHQTTEPSSGPSPRTASWTCAPSERTSQQEQSHDGGHRREHTITAHALRGAGAHGAGGLPLDRPSESGDPTTEAIAVTSPSNMAVQGVIAVSVLPDLHLAGPGQSTRCIPRRQAAP